MNSVVLGIKTYFSYPMITKVLYVKFRGCCMNIFSIDRLGIDSVDL